MKPPVFNYHDPDSLDDVLSLLGQLDDAKLLAGGQSLLPMMNMRFVMPEHIIDLNRLSGLDDVRVDAARIQIGAMTRQRVLLESDLLQARCPLMTEALQQVGHRATRNRGTLGGSLCHLDPAAELPVALAAHDAIVRVRAPEGERSIAMADFPAFYMTPAIEPNELVTGVEFAPWIEGHGHAFVEYSRRLGDFAIVAVGVLVELHSDTQVNRCSIVLGGVGAGPLRLSAAEELFCAGDASDAAAEQASRLCRGIDAMQDVHASREYRQRLGSAHGSSTQARRDAGTRMNTTRTVRLSVNGELREADIDVRTTLADFLRHHLELTGTHLGCEHGVCGACTVLVDGASARSCLMLAVQAHGREVSTVEGLAHEGELNPLQQAFRDKHGLQCGFCTPGILMALTEFLNEHPDPNEAEVREALSGNLCRCTGYQGIVAAALDAAKRLREEPAR